MPSKLLRHLFVFGIIAGLLVVSGAAAPQNTSTQDEDPLKRQKTEKQ
jgi:hypothetical protein